MTISIGQVGVATPTTLNSGTPLSTAAVTTAASGSGFVVMVAASAGTTNVVTYVLVDSFGNPYTQLAQLIYTSGGSRYTFDRWYIAPGAAGYVGGGAGHTATITPTDTTAAPDTWMALIEMPGAASSNAAFYGAAASHQYPFSHAPPYNLASLVVAPPASGAILLSGLLCQQPTTATTGTESTGFTVETTSQLRTTNGGAIGVRAVTASATYTPSWSWSNTSGIAEAFSSVESFFGGSAIVAPTSYMLESTDYF
jgi:hypothetical protein